MGGCEPPLAVPPPGGEGVAARRPPLLALLAFLLATPASAQESRIVGERGGWVVEAYTIGLESGEIRYCVASRPQDPPPRLGFMATRATVGLLLDLGPPELEPGGTYAVELAVDDAGGTRRPARPVTPTILGMMEGGTDVAAILAPFARGRMLAFRVPARGPQANRVPLTGSSWAIQTLGECRTNHVE